MRSRAAVLLAVYPLSSSHRGARAGDGLKEQLEALRAAQGAQQQKAAQQAEELSSRAATAEAAAIEASAKHSTCLLPCCRLL